MGGRGQEPGQERELPDLQQELAAADLVAFLNATIVSTSISGCSFENCRELEMREYVSEYVRSRLSHGRSRSLGNGLRLSWMWRAEPRVRRAAVRQCCLYGFLPSRLSLFQSDMSLKRSWYFQRGMVIPSAYEWRVRRRIARLYGELKLIEVELEADAGASANDLLARLDRLAERANRLRVPDDFAHFVYHLRDHIDSVRARLQRGPGASLPS